MSPLPGLLLLAALLVLALVVIARLLPAPAAGDCGRDDCPIRSNDFHYHVSSD